jgi:hypothetical protein
LRKLATHRAQEPETIYFTEQDGKRGAIAVVDLADASKVPGVAEPWFLGFNADVKCRIAMTPDDLKKAGLDALGKKWAQQIFPDWKRARSND